MTAILCLGQGALATARRIQQACEGAEVLGLAERVSGADATYENFGQTLRGLYRQGRPLIALCAAGIVIRALAEVLQEKGAEPPVLAVAEDGSAVVPLLGGLAGVNRLAREIGDALAVAPAITTSGELRFGTCLLNPPAGYALADLEQGKRFVSDLLAGQPVRIEGQAPWLAGASLSEDPGAERAIRVAVETSDDPHALMIHPRSLVAVVEPGVTDPVAAVTAALSVHGLAVPALACLLAEKNRMDDAVLHSAAAALGVPVRFVDDVAAQVAPWRQWSADGVLIAGTDVPLVVDSIGQRRGRLAVIGLGPGSAALLAPAVRAELDQAEDILGYETYVRMAGPFREDQVRHCSDNREELDRARHAFELAATGRRVVVVSSGDPGVFAMAAAVLEALHDSDEPTWQQVDLQMLPGISASLATAAQAGAPLGHDFCLISLSDNLKPWSIIEKRLDLAADADMAMAFYNPISKARPWQLGKALDIVRRHRGPQTPVVLGRDIERPGQTLRVVTLGELTPEMVDMRTMVIIGSSTTCVIPKGRDGVWVYTPRWYR